MKTRKPDQQVQAWLEARRRHHLSHAQVQMACELQLNPTKLGKMDNHDQESWKMPLPLYIEHLYRRRFGKERPDVVLSIEERWWLSEEKRQAKRAARMQRRSAAPQVGRAVPELGRLP
jgi:hypothetical protein